MPFPINVIFRNRLTVVVTTDNKERILRYIEQYILEDKANNVSVKDMAVEYKGSTSYWNTSLFRPIDKGIISLEQANGIWYVNYHINVRKLFIYAAIISIVMGCFMLANEGPWWVGIIAFAWLCGANWIIIYFRHSIVANNIANGIDDLIHGKTEEPEDEVEDKMTGKLKSWF